jgi:hypothetical protein
VDEARIAELAPDVVITQTHCEVCAVTLGDVAHGPARLQRQPVVALTAGTLAAIVDGFRRVAGVLGLPRAETRSSLASRRAKKRSRPSWRGPGSGLACAARPWRA